MAKVASKYKGIIYIIISAFCFAVMNLFVRASGDLPAFQKSFFRNLVAVFFAAVILFKNKSGFRWKKGNLKFLLLRASVGTIGIVCNFYALGKIPLSDASMLNKMSPFFVIVFSLILLKEKLTLLQGAAVFTAFIGTLFIIKPSFQNIDLLPSAIGSLLTATVASLIDVVILSHYLGPSMLAVVELCMPVYMLVNTLAMLISSGAATLYAHYLGEGDREEALRWFSASAVHMLVSGGVLTLAGLLFTGPIVRLLGANDAIMEPTMAYAHVLFFFMIPLMVYVHLVFFVRVDNDPNRVLAATSVCALANLVLDILFVGPLGWGPRGAALATCLAYTVGMAVNLTHFLSKRNTLKLMGNCLRGRGLRMWQTGMPLAASQLGMTVSTNVFNNVIIRRAPSPLSRQRPARV